MIKLGDKIKFTSLKDTKILGMRDWANEYVGRIIYINNKHRWFLVEYDIGSGLKLRTSFKFHDLGGDAVKVA